MPTWGDLPRVVRLLILRKFCADLVPDLKALRQTVGGRVRLKLDREAIAAGQPTPKDPPSAEEPALEWPPAPTSLTSFLSAVTTCREFADLILTEIKFDARSTADLLLETQFANVTDMTDTVATGFFEPFGMLMSFGGERVDELPKSSYLPEVGVYYEVAGCFWKNPEFIKSLMMVDVLQFSTRRSSQLLLPHLGPCLQHHHATAPSKFPKWPSKLCYYHDDPDFEDGDDEDGEAEEYEEMDIDPEEIAEITKDEGNETMVKTEGVDEEMKEEEEDDFTQEQQAATYWGEGEIECDDHGWVVDCFYVQAMPMFEDPDLYRIGALHNTPAANQDPSSGREPPPRPLAHVDIATSPSGQWWIVFPYSEANRKVRIRDDLQWFLVNYEEERMYVGPFAHEALVWKGRDVWDVRTWVTLTTMEEIQDHGRDILNLS